MIDDEIDWHERLNNFRVDAELLYRAAHRSKIDNQRHAGEILEHDPRDHERDLFIRGFLRIPFRQRLNVFAPDFFSVAIAQHGFEDNPNTHRQSRNFSHTLLLQRRERIQKSLAAVAGVEFFQGLEFVRHFSTTKSTKLENSS